MVSSHISYIVYSYDEIENYVIFVYKTLKYICRHSSYNNILRALLLVSWAFIVTRGIVHYFNFKNLNYWAEARGTCRLQNTFNQSINKLSLMFFFKKLMGLIRVTLFMFCIFTDSNIYKQKRKKGKGNTSKSNLL